MTSKAITEVKTKHTCHKCGRKECHEGWHHFIDISRAIYHGEIFNSERIGIFTVCQKCYTTTILSEFFDESWNQTRSKK